MTEKVFNISRYIILIIILIYSFIILLIYALPLMKLNPLSINNENMKPNYTTGSLVLLNEVDVTEIFPDDVVAYTSMDNKYNYDVSRIVDKNIEKRLFEIKGDNSNINNEEQIPYVRVLGKVVYDIPYIGYINNFITETKGKIISGTIIFGLLIIPYTIKFLLHD